MFDQPSLPETPRAPDETIVTAELAGAKRRHADVVAEIRRQQEQRAGWGQTLLILAISLALFVSITSGGWSWEMLVLLVSILLLHELGHLMAMRVFKYRNLRMFFIPLFGAAVTGKNYNVAGWKKAVVSLMGPVPGIAIAIPLGLAGLALQHQTLLQGALLMLVLNGLNLVPVLPLDGGWSMHAILFSRHHVLDAGFRFVAALALIALGWLGLGRFLGVLGLLMLLGLPAAYRVARAVTNLRNRGVMAASPDDQHIAPETAELIIDEVRAAFPTGLDRRRTAQWTLQVFESLNARPPGWAVSLLLGGVHAASLVAAIVFGAAFIVFQHTDLGSLINVAADQPGHRYQAGTMRQRRGADVKERATDAEQTVVVNFGRARDAEQAYERIIPQVPRDARQVLFGQSVFVALPAEDSGTAARLLTDLQTSGGEGFVARAKAPALCTLLCVAKDARSAKAIEEEVLEYLQVPPPALLLPPWSMRNDSQLTAEQRKARQTFVKLSHPTRSDDAEVRVLTQRLIDAYRASDQAAIRDLNQRLSHRHRALEQLHWSAVRQEGDSRVDTGLVDLYAHRPAVPEPLEAEGQDPTGVQRVDQEYAAALQAWHRALGQRMGQLPIVEGQVVPAADRHCTRYGHVVRSGLLLRFNGLNFVQIADGLPALAEWLCGKGCVDLKYAVTKTPEEIWEEGAQEQ
jgi:Zn-dependent protease